MGEDELKDQMIADLRQHYNELYNLASKSLDERKADVYEKRKCDFKRSIIRYIVTAITVVAVTAIICFSPESNTITQTNTQTVTTQKGSDK